MGELADFLREPLKTINGAMAGTSDLNAEYGDPVPPTTVAIEASRVPGRETLVQKVAGNITFGPSSV